MTDTELTWRLWVDDVRPPPDASWTWARTNKRARELLEAYRFDECSLDHDMGLHDLDVDDDDPECWDKVIEIASKLRPRHEDSGDDLVGWMIDNGHVPALVTIHSWNPDGARRMAARLANAGFDCYVSPFKPRKR
jgi:hypothetical protein